MTRHEITKELPGLLLTISLTVPDVITEDTLIDYAHAAFHDYKRTALRNLGLAGLKAFAIGVEVGRKMQQSSGGEDSPVGARKP